MDRQTDRQGVFVFTAVINTSMYSMRYNSHYFC